MTTSWRTLAGVLLLLAGGLAPSSAVELKVSREALERTLKQQLFSGPNGRYYRIVVRLKTHARLGRHVGGSCLGITLALPAEVSVAPDGEGETIGFRDARMDKVSDHAELNFVLTPFLSHQIPSSMKLDAADLLRKALEGSTASTGYKVTLQRLKIHSMQIQGDDLVVDVDGDLSIK